MKCGINNCQEEIGCIEMWEMHMYNRHPEEWNKYAIHILKQIRNTYAERIYGIRSV